MFNGIGFCLMYGDRNNNVTFMHLEWQVLNIRHPKPHIQSDNADHVRNQQ